MEARFSYDKAAPGVYKAMIGVEQYLKLWTGRVLLHLIRLRASQINGCAYCLDMHWKDLRAIGEQEQRLYSLDAWRECPYYTERERAALAWTEAVTLTTTGHVPDPVYEEVQRALQRKRIVGPNFRCDRHQHVEPSVNCVPYSPRNLPSCQNHPLEKGA